MIALFLYWRPHGDLNPGRQRERLNIRTLALILLHLSAIQDRLKVDTDVYIAVTERALSNSFNRLFGRAFFI
jgi:hypothetical protein